MIERLQKYMANAGIASRRKCEELISSGMVKVNGKTIKEMGVKINPDIDTIEVNGKVIKEPKKFVYILLNKPIGYITSVKDQFNRPTVMDLISTVKERVYPVGRLDYDTSGLLLITNDGDITYKLTHPRHEVEKTYLALVQGIPDGGVLEKFRNGLIIDDYITSQAWVKVVKTIKNNALLKIKIHEGRNRQVRKMCQKIGHPVINLQRIAIGKITLQGLKEGEWRYLNTEEIEYLHKL